MIKGICAAFIFYVGGMIIAVNVTSDPTPTLAISILVLSIIGGILVGSMGYKAAAKEVAVQTKTFANKTAKFSKEISKEVEQRTNKKEKNLTEMKAYELAGEEIENKNMKMGLWHKAFAEADGDVNKQKALYLKARVKELIQ